MSNTNKNGLAHPLILTFAIVIVVGCAIVMMLNQSQVVVAGSLF